MPLTEVRKLKIGVYYILLHDGYIHRLKQSENGCKYLADCKRLSETEMDSKVAEVCRKEDI